MEVNIDFDEASKFWRENKKQISPGMFVYTCNYIHAKNNKKCNSIVYSNKYCDSIVYSNKYCKRHRISGIRQHSLHT